MEPNPFPLEIYKFAFMATSILVVPFWLLLIFFPKLAFTRKLADRLWLFLLLALPYALLELPNSVHDLPLFAFPQFDNIHKMISEQAGTTLVWVHFLPMDLFVGRWIYLDSRERDYPPLVMGPILAMTLFFGPTGLLLYLIFRSLRKPATD